MPWQMDEFVRERVERARRLLEDSEAHRGAPDLQAFLEAMHFRTQLHRMLLDRRGRPRRDLSDRDAMQALVLLLRYNLSALTCPLCMVDVEDKCQTQAIQSAMLMLVKDRQPGSVYDIKTSEALLGAIAFHAWILQPRCGLGAEGRAKYDAECFEASTWSQRDQHLAAQLEWQLQEGGFNPAISAVQLRLVRTILCHQSSAARFSQTGSRVFAGIAKAAGQQMMRLDPSSPGLQLRRAMSLVETNLLPLSRIAYAACLEAAVASKAHLCTSVAAADLAVCLMLGGGGPQWAVAEVQRLVEQAEAQAALCKPWLLKHMRKELDRVVLCARQSLSAILAAHPGQAQLPHILNSAVLGVLSRDRGMQRWLARNAARYSDQPVQRAACASCGKQSLQLMKCASCKAVSYCSKQCQAAHWKAGGHKAECKALAAARKACSSGSRP